MQHANVYPDTQGLPWPGPHGMEHRFGHRLLCGTQVMLSAGAGIAGNGRLVNVSLSGAYLETTVDLPLFARVAIQKIRDGGRGIQLHASVVRKDADGVGVEWCETPSRSICLTFGCPRPCAHAD